MTISLNEYQMSVNLGQKYAKVCKDWHTI